LFRRIFEREEVNLIMKYRLLGFVVTLLLLLANIASASACLGGQYQPEVPESLRR